MLSNFTDNYNKDEGSNIEKINEIIQREIDELVNLFRMMKINLDVDVASGKLLDKIGANVLEFRSTPNDDLYRQLIKTKIIANRSHGDIETINDVCRTLLGDKYLGISEGWYNESINYEPASLLMSVKSSDTPLPYNDIRRIIAGGVGLRWLLNFNQDSEGDIFVGGTNISSQITTIYPKRE